MQQWSKGGGVKPGRGHHVNYSLKGGGGGGARIVSQEACVPL